MYNSPGGGDFTEQLSPFIIKELSFMMNDEYFSTLNVLS